MKSEGNGEPILCAQNLLRLLRGDIPLDGLRGLPRDVIDRPQSIVVPEVRESIRWVCEHYEPRLTAEEIEENING